MHLNLQIEKIVHNGYGLSRHQGMTVFIPYTIENETVEIKEIQSKKNYGYAYPLKITDKSPHRIEPSCPYFQVCGGCDFQHIAYDHQVEIKQKIIKEEINKNKLITGQPISFIPSEGPYHYRLNTRLHIRDNRTGFFKKNSREIVLIDNCPLLHQDISDCMRSLNKKITVPSLIIKTDNDHHISSNIKPERLCYRLDGLDIYYDHRIFFQANIYLITKWLNTIKDMFSRFNKNRVVELYCGAGIISLFLARHFIIKKMTGVDNNNNSINFAKMNREKNKLFNIKFFASQAEKAIDEFTSVNVVIVNPPRTGVDKDLLKKIVKLNPEAIIYSSCEISTFLRDAVILKDKYSIEKITALDMFPQTYHFETVGLFVRQ